MTNPLITDLFSEAFALVQQMQDSSGQGVHFALEAEMEAMKTARKKPMGTKPLAA